MAKKWSEITESNEFNSLADDQKEKVRTGYFDRHILPKINDPAKAPMARAEWDKRTLPKPAQKQTSLVPEGNKAEGFSGLDSERDGPIGFSVDQAQKLAGQGIKATSGALGFDKGVKYGESIVKQQDKDIAEGGYQPEYEGSFRENLNKGVGDAAGWTWEKLQENLAVQGVQWGTRLAGAGLMATGAGLPAGAALIAASGLSTGLFSVGESSLEQEESGAKINDLAAVGTGAAVAALDFFGAGKVLPKTQLKELAKNIDKMTGDELIGELRSKGAKEAADKLEANLLKAASSAKQSMAKRAGRGFAVEAVTESAQEGIMMSAAALLDGEYKAQEVVDRLIDSAVLGGAMGAAASPMSGSYTPDQERARILQNPDASPNDRIKAARVIAGEYQKDSPAMAAAMLNHATKRILTKKPFLNEGESFYESIKPLERHEVDQELKAQAEQVLALPDPKDMGGAPISVPPTNSSQMPGPNDVLGTGVDQQSPFSVRAEDMNLPTITGRLRNSVEHLKAARQSGDKEAMSRAAKETRAWMEAQSMVRAGRLEEAESFLGEQARQAVKQIEEYQSSENEFNSVERDERRLGGLQNLTGELLSKKEGNNALVPDPNWVRGEGDAGDAPLIRSSSVNPAWFQENSDMTSVDYVRKTVQKAVAGEKLGAKEQRVIDAMIEEVDYRNGEEDIWAAISNDTETAFDTFLNDDEREALSNLTPERRTELNVPEGVQWESLSAIYQRKLERGVPEAELNAIIEESQGLSPSQLAGALLNAKGRNEESVSANTGANQIGSQNDPGAQREEGGGESGQATGRQPEQVTTAAPQGAVSTSGEAESGSGESVPVSGIVVSGRPEGAGADTVGQPGSTTDAGVSGGTTESVVNQDDQAILTQEDSNVSKTPSLSNNEEAETQTSLNAESEGETLSLEQEQDGVAVDKPDAVAAETKAQVDREKDYFNLDNESQGDTGATTKAKQADALDDANQEIERDDTQRDIYSRRLEGLSEEELRDYVRQLRTELMTDERTGLGSNRAWINREPKNNVASIDLDSLKWVNDNLGHEAGDRMIALVGEALRKAGLGNDSFHVSGDEFYAHDNDAARLKSRLRIAQDWLANQTVGEGDNAVSPAFSYGIGKDITTAEQELSNDKARREETGERTARGQRPASTAGGRGQDQRSGEVATDSPETARAGQEQDIDSAANEAATSPTNDTPTPTDDQKAAGNYKKGHFAWNGLDISVENPKGSTRSGTDDNGNAWENTMQAHYGYLKRTVGADEEHVDVFFGDNESSGKVYIIDQRRENGSRGPFDEHKVMLGFSNKMEATKAYKDSYAKGWVVGNMTTSSVDELKAWLADGDLSKPYSGQSKQSDDSKTTKGTKLADPAAEKFEDFGEKIEGAKKHTASLRESLSDEVDVSALPLSKTFPKPDYEKLADAGVPAESLFLVAFLRKQIPNKPRRSNLVKRWAEKVETMRSFANDILNGDVSSDKVIADMSKLGGDFSGIKDIVALANEVLPGQIESLTSYTLSEQFYNLFRGEENVTKWVATNKNKAGGFGGMGNMAHFETKDEALAYIKSKVSVSNEAGKPLVKFDMWTERGKDGTFVGKKVGTGKYIELGNFNSTKEAKEYIVSHNDELAELLKKKKHIGSHRRAEQNQRIGKDYRRGENVTSDLFSETFGFRGVQFGNYVENDRRQQDLNNAYDGLLDLAGVLGVPPKAISLNGELGLAFGARGRGGKESPSAHYEPGDKVEPGNVVINLTKKSGPGSLAHEWWHALDNYFARMGELKDPKGGSSITDLTRPKRKRIVEDGVTKFVEVDPNDFGVRPEVYDAFKSLIKDIHSKTELVDRSSILDGRKTKDYWSTTHELSARAFERYVIDKLAAEGYESDYLATVLPKDAWDATEAMFGNTGETYPYPTDEEAKVTNAAYQKIFDELKTKETDSGVALFRESGTSAPVSIHDASEAVAAIKAKWNAVVAGRVSTVETFADLPANVQKAAKDGGGSEKVRGVFHDDRFYVISSNHSSLQDVEETVFHEGYGHLGLNGLFGKDVRVKMNELFLAIGGSKGLNTLAEKHGINLTKYAQRLSKLQRDGKITPEIRNAVMMEELLSHMAEDQRPSVARRAKEIIGMIRQWLRKNGFNLLGKVSDSEIAALLKKSRDAVMTNDKNGSFYVKGGEALFNDQPAWYRSALSDTVSGMDKIADKNGMVQPNQAKLWLQSQQKKGAFKQEELEWVGVNEWLDTQDGKVAVDDIQAFVDANGVQVEEVEKGGVFSYVSPDGHEQYYSSMEEAEKNYNLDSYWVENDSAFVDESDSKEITVYDHENAPIGHFQEYEDGWYSSNIYSVGSYEKNRYVGDRDEALSEANDITETVKDSYRNEMGEVTSSEGNDGSGAKYSDYQLPGGENYRELLLTLPQRGTSQIDQMSDAQLRALILTNDHNADPESLVRSELLEMLEGMELSSTDIERMTGGKAIDYKSPHWDQPNVLAHIRMNDRTDADGTKVLFIEEVQSDWAQDGRKNGFKKGFKDQVQTNGLPQGFKVIKEGEYFNVVDSDGDTYADRETPAKTEEEAIERALAQVKDELDVGASVPNGAPGAPFLKDTKSWTALAMKRITAYAAQNGYAKVAFINGEQSAERYDLSKQVSEVNVNLRPNGNYDVIAYPLEGPRTNAVGDAGYNVPAENVADLIGKELADRALSEISEKRSHGDLAAVQYQGVDLKVGGEGMKAYYDQIVPQVARDVLKKLGGGRPEPVSVNDVGSATGFTITDAMREKVNGGLPLFRKGDHPFTLSGTNPSDNSKTGLDAQAILARNWNGNAGESVAAAVREAKATANRDVVDWLQTNESRLGNDDVAMFRYEDSDSSGFAIPDDTLVSVAIRKMQDKFKILKDLQANIKEAGGNIDETNDAYLAEELFHGKAENDLRLMREQYVEPLASKMADFGIERADLDRYLYAKHAPERNAHIATINSAMKDGGSGMTNAEAAQVVADVQESGKQDQYDQLAGIVYDMLQVQRDLVRNSGLEADEAINAWESKYKNYVPLKGFAEDTKGEGIPRTGKGFNIGGKESKRAMGRGSEAASPVSYAITDLTEKLIRKRKNEVGNALLKLVQDNPNKDYWQVFTDENPDTDRRIVKVKDPATGEMVEQVRETTIPMQMMSDRYFTTKKDGKTYFIKLADERLMRAMKNLGPETNGALIRTLGGINRILSSLNTSYSPEFVISNFARDIQTALLNLQAEQSLPQGKATGTKIAAKTAKDTPAAMKAIYASLRGRTLKGSGAEWQAMFDQFRADGAKTGWFDMKDLDGQIKDIDNLVSMAKGGTKGNALKFMQSASGFVENLNQAVENAVRLSAYVNGIKAGLPRSKAASLAKNMTVNFNRKGEIGTTLNALYMFSNASIQGVANFARTMATLKGDKTLKWSNLNNAQRIAVGLVAGSYFLAMANRMGAGEDDDDENWYDKVPDYVRERNLVIMKSLFGGAPGEYWKIPLPYGYNAFHVLGDGMESVFSGNKSVGEAGTEMALAVLGSFSPIGFQESETISGLFWKNAAPTVVKPVADILANENFMGTSIYSENFPFGTPKPESSLARRSTPEAYKKVAEWLNEATGGSQYRSGVVDVNPDVMRYVIDYFGGSAYSFLGSKVPDTVHRLASGVEMEPHRTPFLSRVSGKVLPYEDMDKFYKRRDEIGQIRNEVRSLTGRERAEFYREHRGKLGLDGMIKSTEKRLKVLRGQRDAIYARDLPLSERDPLLKDVETRMKAAVDRFNKSYATASESQK